jgi:urea transporter
MTPVASSAWREHHISILIRISSRPEKEVAMGQVWLQSALWLGLALLASLVSIRVAVSVALVEIVVGAVAGNLIGLQITDWVNFLAGFGAILLTFRGSSGSISGRA